MLIKKINSFFAIYFTTLCFFVNKESLALTSKEASADVRFLATTLLETHPDPLRNYGNILNFRRAERDILDSVSNGNIDVQDFFAKIRPLAAKLGDGHTKLFKPLSNDDTTFLPLKFEVIEDTIFVSAVLHENHKNLLGFELQSIENIQLSEALNRLKNIEGLENRSHQLVHLIRTISGPSNLQDLMQTSKSPSGVTLGLRRNKEHKNLTFSFENLDTLSIIRPTSKVSLPKLNKSKIGWHFLEHNPDVAHLTIASSQKYREVFEIAQSNLKSSQVNEMLKEEFPNIADSNQLLEKKISQVPSAGETLFSLFKEMRLRKTKTLLVDLRENQGGSSAITLALIRLLYSWEQIEMSPWGFQIPRYSKLYFENFPNAKVTFGIPNFAVGDYDFSGEKNYMAQSTKSKPKYWDRNEIIATLSSSPTFFDLFKAPSPQPFWKPENIIVLTSAKTFSSGFNIAMVLEQLGAQIVGVPAAQSGNCFTDALKFPLPNSKIEGQISFKLKMGYPTNLVKGNMLLPNIELTKEVYAKYNGDPNATVILALEALE